MQEQLLSPLTTVINTGFGTNRHPDAIRRHAFECNTLMLAFEETKNLVGFASFSSLLVMSPRELLSDLRVLYLYGTVVKPEFQGRGVATKFMQLAVEQGKNTYSHVAMRTQNPAAYLLMSKVTPNFYPRLGIRTPSDVMRVAKFIALMHQMENFNPETLVGKGVYEGLLTAQEIIYQGTHPAGREFNNLGLNPKNGDCVIVVGCLK